MAMNERDEPMKGLADYLRASASIAECDYPTAANSGTTLRRWAEEVEASRQRSAVGAESDGNLNLVWNTLRFFCSESSYTTGERTGGVLAGCSRDPAPTVVEMAQYARWGMAALQRFLGQESEAWLLDGSPVPAAPPSGRPAAPAQIEREDASFQQRVQPWMMACFGERISSDITERNHRFIEEALELVQASGCTQSEAHQLVDYVYGRPSGEITQEVGGVMVTLAALCLAHGIDMHASGETELARIWTKVDAIRAKQAAKPQHFPLPAQAGVTDAQAVLTELVACVDGDCSTPEKLAYWEKREAAAWDRARARARSLLAGAPPAQSDTGSAGIAGVAVAGKTGDEAQQNGEHSRMKPWTR